MRCFRRKLKPSLTTIPPQKQIWRGEYMRVVDYQKCLKLPTAEERPTAYNMGFQIPIDIFQT